MQIIVANPIFISYSFYMKKLYILLILFAVLLLASCSQKKSDNVETAEIEEPAVTQEQFLANKLKEYLDANPLFL